MRLHVAAALSADEVELPAQLLAGADARVMFAPVVTILRRNDVEDRGADETFCRRADHGAAGRVHLQQGAIGGDELDAVGRGLDDRLERPFILSFTLFRAL